MSCYCDAALSLPEALDKIQELHQSIAALSEELDNAKWVAHTAWDYIAEGCFGDEITMGDPDTPEWDLWIKKMVWEEVVHQNPWVKETPGEENR